LEQLAELCFVKVADVQKWEHGQSEPEVAQRVLILKILEVAKEKGFISDPDRD